MPGHKKEEAKAKAEKKTSSCRRRVSIVSPVQLLFLVRENSVALVVV